MISRRLTHWPLWCWCSIVVVLSVVHPGEARPLYKKAFDTVYADIAKKCKTNCSICHVEGTDDKKGLNHYGKALAKELGEKNVKDMEKIIAAIKAIAKRKCKSGEWQDRLERGLPPCRCSDEDADSYIARQLARERHQSEAGRF